MQPAFPIAGIGASAGGLEAFTRLLRAMPADSGVALVLVQHLAPGYASSLAEILSRATSMPVSEVQEELLVEPNHVYVIPPGKTMVITKGHLQLQPRRGTGTHHLIDLFLASLAQDQGHAAIGVILSGTATDGTLGLKEIKAAGGTTFVQDESAQQDSMPRSAISTGCVDFVLPPERIAAEIVRIASHPYVRPEPQMPRAEKPDAAALEGILQLLHGAKEIDFSHYKPNTLNRRVTRRMMLHKIETLAEYERYLGGHPGEVDALYQDILIGVTGFFRDPEVFEALKSDVLPKLLAGRSRHDPLRVWVLGCSTGEEAYSYCIALAEFAETDASVLPIQLFATDINAAAIETARAGLYPRGIAESVSQARLRRYFTEMDGSFRVTKSIRDACVFARHNLLTDPPFSRMDLISCRNLLIYLEPALQQKVLPMLHYALKPNGYLVLGGSETIGSYRDLFHAQDVKHRIYTRLPGAGRTPPTFAGRDYVPRPSLQAPMAAQEAAPAGGAQKEADRILLSRFAPPGVLVNADMEIVQFRGETSRYLAPAEGKASFNVLKMAREGLLVGLAAALRKAQRERSPASERGLRVRTGAGWRETDIEVIPLRSGGEREAAFLVLFEDRSGEAAQAQAQAEAPSHEPGQQKDAAAEAPVEQLRQELAATREYLQSIIEQQEAANEELQTASEEVQSSNEELQSINEELETSKEEIESSNEELATVNEELQNRNRELGRLNDDLVNLLSSIDTVVVMVGQDLRIRRYTPRAEKIFNLIPGDIGRPLSDIRLNLSVPGLAELLAEVIDQVTVKELEVQDKQGRWQLLRVRPYRTLDNRIDGAVLLLVDVDSIRRAREFAQSIVATVREPLLVLDAELRVQSASRSYYQKFGSSAAQTEHRPFHELDGGRWDVPALRQALVEVLAQNKAFDGFEVRLDDDRGCERTMLLNSRRLLREAGEPPLILVAIEDVTDALALREARQRVALMEQADRSRNEFLAMLAHELRNPLVPLRLSADVLRLPSVDPASAQRSLGVIDRQVKTMTRLIDDLLDSARITQGKIELRRERVDLVGVLTVAASSTRAHFGERRQDFSVSLPGRPLPVEGDATRLEQVFVNLLHNASKFTPARGHISLSAEREPPADGPGEVPYVRVRVRDDGVGMSPELREHVFELFTQADRSLDHSQGGLGIGLTLVRKLTEMHGGTVEAASEGPGKGSEFTVRLPLGGELPDRPVARADEAARRDQPAAKRTPRRVLIVDDNRDVTEALAVALRLSGHSAQGVQDAAAAPAAARELRPEVIVLDIGLPGMNGYELARTLREDPVTAGALLVAVTGYGKDEDRSRSRDAGFDHHLTKPIELEDLLRLFDALPSGDGVK